MYDAIIVGARCAGSPTAMLLAKAGHSVLVVDRATFPSDTLSTHYITPDGVARLREWGLLDRILATGVPKIPGVQRTMGGMTFPPSPNDPLGICPRRTILDKIFVDAASEAGAEIREGVLVESLIEEDGTIVGVRCRKGDERFEERGRVIIGADGRESFVARQVNAEAYNEVDGHCGGYYGYYKNFDGDQQELYLGGGYAIFVFRTNDNEACVGVEMTAGNHAAFRADIESSIRTALATQPSVLERYDRAERSGKVMGLTPHKSFYRKPFGPGWALVGDAGYYRDPLLGQGINDALRDAEELAKALTSVLSGAAGWDSAMSAYQQQRDTATSDIYQLTALLTKDLDPSQETLAMLAAGPPSKTEQPTTAPV
jgi:flavin-dependent dehydrogenase